MLGSVVNYSYSDLVVAYMVLWLGEHVCVQNPRHYPCNLSFYL